MRFVTIGTDVEYHIALSWSEPIKDAVRAANRVPDPTGSTETAPLDEESRAQPLPKPSLATIEKAAAARIFFETKYHAILRQPQSRERSRAVFERELARLNLPDSKRRRIRAAWLESQSRYLRELRDRIGPTSFVKLKTIGHGAFGVVSLVRERGKGQ